jgi:hypothetical protein
MAEANQITFGYQEVAEALVKKQGIHEGFWGVYIEFGFAAANVANPADAKSIVPTAFNMVQKIGIQRFPEANNLTVDAAKVNPKKSQTTGAGGLALGKTKRK